MTYFSLVQRKRGHEGEAGRRETNKTTPEETSSGYGGQEATTALFWCGCGSLYKLAGDVINVQLVRIFLSLVTFYGVSIQGDTASPIYFTL